MAKESCIITLNIIATNVLYIDACHQHNFNPPTPVPPTNALAQKKPCPRGHEIYNFGRPFPGNHYYIHVLDFSDPCLRVEKKTKNIAFSLYD